MNIFHWLFENLVYKPQLNILQFLYNVTGDIGISIILLALIINLCLWPLFASMYVNGQKMKVLQPKLNEIREKHKDNQQELVKATLEFNKKHKINNGSIILVLIGQIFIASGLWSLTNDVSTGKQIQGLYNFLFNTDAASFSTQAFGSLAIGDSASMHIWLPTINAVLSFLFGMYLFRWAPKPKFPTPAQPAKKDGDTKAALDPEAFLKMQEFQTIYVMPIFLFLINYRLTVGVNLYFVTVSLLSLARQIFLTNFYANHTDKLIEEIAASDPTSKDDNPGNDIEDVADANQLMDQASPVLVEKKPSPTSEKAKYLNKIAKNKPQKSKKR
jgi:YidC/Oxa1 family membrane protein insertase